VLLEHPIKFRLVHQLPETISRLIPR
jgi:hypothetical protein